MSDVTEVDGEHPAGSRARGSGSFTQWLDSHLPRWFVRHSLTTGWLWLVLWFAFEVAQDLTDLPVWPYVITAVLLATPSLGAAALCLHATPRDHLTAQRSVLADFLIRFVTVVFGFFAWTTSIVIGASISSTIQLIGNNDEAKVLGIGFQLVIAFAPLVATLIWAGFIIRCTWFLGRVRGWRARPTATKIPSEFLVDAPRVRQWLVGLAHPGLLLVTGTLSVFTAITFAADATVGLSPEIFG